MKTFRVAPEWFQLSAITDTRAVGFTYTSAFVVRGTEPGVIDTAAPVHREAFFEALFELVAPEDLRWVFLTHDDRDHAGNVVELLERCPNARLLTTVVGVIRMRSAYAIPMGRVQIVNAGESFSAGDRTLAAVSLPVFDSPGTRGIFDPKAKVVCAADAFGAFVPQPVAEASEVPSDAYNAGFARFNHMNFDWPAWADRTLHRARVSEIAALGAEVLTTCHGPIVRGRVRDVCEQLAGLPETTPPAPPTQAQWNDILRAIRPAEAEAKR